MRTNLRTIGTTLAPAIVALVIAAPAAAAVNVGAGISVPGVSIGINMPYYPELVPVPGLPVYYAPGLAANYFFYDGMYWVYADDAWYASTWYDGPWDMIQPEFVPDYLLRVPVAFYRRPPDFFMDWDRDAPPHWGEHFGRNWAVQRPGWNHWNPAAMPKPAPLPTYQRDYPREKYPAAEQQQPLHFRQYGYEPHEPMVRDRWYGQQMQHMSSRREEKHDR